MTIIDYLVFSEQHGLVPLAHRLRLHEVPTELIIRKRSFEKAWDGKINKALKKADGTLNHENLDFIRERVATGATALITDSPHLHGFEGPNIFAHIEWPDEPKSTARVGAWFNGEHLVGHHLLVADVGAWPGGMGPSTLGGITMIIPEPGMDLGFMDELWQPIVDRLKPVGFKGLVQAGMRQSVEDGGIELHGVEAGWPWLHTHAWLSELVNLTDVLSGEAPPSFEAGQRYVVALPVSVPPWPVWPVQPGSRAPEGLPVEGLTPQDAAQMFWHDVTIDEEARVLRTAGQDGLLGIARGSAHSLELARARALERASRLAVPNKQHRADVAMQTAGVLASLELQFGVKVG